MDRQGRGELPVARRVDLAALLGVGRCTGSQGLAVAVPVLHSQTSGIFDAEKPSTQIHSTPTAAHAAACTSSTIKPVCAPPNPGERTSTVEIHSPELEAYHQLHPQSPTPDPPNSALSQGLTNWPQKNLPVTLIQSLCNHACFSICTEGLRPPRLCLRRVKIQEFTPFVHFTLSRRWSVRDWKDRATGEA